MSFLYFFTLFMCHKKIFFNLFYLIIISKTLYYFSFINQFVLPNKKKKPKLQIRHTASSDFPNRLLSIRATYSVYLCI